MHAALRNQQLGRFSKAIAGYREVLDLWPGLPDALHFLGLALHQSGRSTEGVRLMRQSVRAQPDNPVFHNNLGLALKAVGQLAEAEAAHREAIRLQPDFAEAWFNLGVTLQDGQKLDGAESAYRQALALRENYAKAYVNLASVLKTTGKLKECVQICNRALLFAPTLPEAHAILTAALVMLQRHHELREWLDRTLPLATGNSRLLTIIGEALVVFDRTEEAISRYRDALKADPACAEAHTGLGRIAQMNGDHARAVNEFARALEIDPASVNAADGLANSAKFSDECKRFAGKWEKMLQGASLSNTARIQFHFVLGKIYDDSKQYDEAFKHISIGNSLKRKAISFDRDAHAARIDQLIDVYSAEFLSNRLHTWGHDSNLPVFVVGMPRSGTTLVEQIISSHPGVMAGGELGHIVNVALNIPTRTDEHAYPICMRSVDHSMALGMAEDYLERLPELQAGIIRVTDKGLGSFLHVGLIAALFKNARIIHCRRDALDVCLSIYFQNFRDPHPYAHDLEDLGFHYQQYQRLASHWRAVLGSRFYEVNYADIVDNQEAVSRNLISHCGLDWDDKCLTFYRNERAVKTVSQWQVRQPIYRTSIRRWKNYEKHLVPLKNALGICESSDE